MLTERIAIALWKMRRVDYFQAVATNSYMNQARANLQLGEAFGRGTLGKGPLPDVSDDAVLAQKARRVLPPANELDKIMRYEAHLHRQLTQILHELEALQIRRKGGTSPLARLDITGAPVG
jgi:hypothetical protein